MPITAFSPEIHFTIESLEIWGLSELQGFQSLIGIAL